MLLRDTIDELDGLIVELVELRDSLTRAEQAESVDNALWDAEAALRRVARRADARAHTVRRAIELQLAEETHRDGPNDLRTA
ncbi:MAG: hypothetical protein KDB02_00045 [Acidimicrobiales bacterium]|nr:hypothetical protein [Acidimicrobiales bacterium]